MKKIFAIALALVMVLSMASAFAWCPTISWACDTYTCTNGTGKVEIIPYVKGNTCGGVGYTFTPNTCAGAVNSDKVYFAIKVTVDADPSEDWWNAAKLEITEKGLSKYVAGTAPVEVTSIVHNAGVVAQLIADENDNVLKAGEYYLVYTTKWEAVKAADFDADAVGSLIAGVVDNASVAKVCAKLTSAADLTDVEINGYKVKYVKGKAGTGAYTLNIVKGGKAVEVYLNADEKIDMFKVYDGITLKYTVKTYSPDKTAFWSEAEDKALSWTCDVYGEFLKAVMSAFAFDFGTCITDKAVKANFGWDAKVENCATWSDKVQAVVDAECVVAIPKTGDASVLAWLF